MQGLGGWLIYTMLCNQIIQRCNRLEKSQIESGICIEEQGRDHSQSLLRNGETEWRNKKNDWDLNTPYQCDINQKLITFMNGCNKLNAFEDSLAIREQTEKKVSMSREYRNYVIICVREKGVRITWISINENMSGIITKPLSRDTHNIFSEIIINTNQRTY